MYCTNCGKTVHEKAAVCLSCGFAPTSEKNYCGNCGVKTDPKQVICIKCGVSLKTDSLKGTFGETNSLLNNSDLIQSKVTSFIVYFIALFCLFFPFVGISLGGKEVAEIYGAQLLMGLGQIVDGPYIYPRPFIWIASIAGLIGMVVTLFSNTKRNHNIKKFSAVTAVVCFAYLGLSPYSGIGLGSVPVQMLNVIKVDFKFGYWGSLIFYILALLLAWLNVCIEDESEKEC